MLGNILLGLDAAFTLQNLWYCFAGVFLGNLIGVIPGIGALAAISMLLPLTYGLAPVTALVMLAGVYYGTSFGGATTSILLNLPGTAAHAIVCLDGNAMARQGRAGSALFIAIFASFVGTLVAIVITLYFSPALSDVALSFGPTEFFALMLIGLLSASALTTGSALKGLVSVLIGLVLGVVGSDVLTGTQRFTFDVMELQEGIPLIGLAMGFFGISDVLANAGKPMEDVATTGKNIKARSLRPAPGEIRQSAGAIGRGTALGSFIGALPGVGGALAAFLSYAVEKKIARDPERFGRGAIEGVAGPEAANSSGDITAFIPTLTLGIPGSAVMALMLGAMMIHNVEPGPLLVSEQPELFFGLVMSFFIGNILLLILNLPLIRIWIKLLTVPYKWVFPVVLLMICIGVYSTNNQLFDVFVTLLFGLFGYLILYLGFHPAPMLLAFVLGPMVEENFRRALLLSDGHLGVCIIAGTSLVAWTSWRQFRRSRRLAATPPL